MSRVRIFNAAKAKTTKFLTHSALKAASLSPKFRSESQEGQDLENHYSSYQNTNLKRWTKQNTL